MNIEGRFPKKESYKGPHETCQCPHPWHDREPHLPRVYRVRGVNAVIEIGPCATVITATTVIIKSPDSASQERRTFHYQANTTGTANLGRLVASYKHHTTVT